MDPHGGKVCGGKKMEIKVCTKGPYFLCVHLQLARSCAERHPLFREAKLTRFIEHQFSFILVLVTM
jgi:hypothetical protein